MIIPFLGRKAAQENAVKILDILATKGNAKEVFLKCNEGLKNVQWKRRFIDDEDDDDGEATLTEKLGEPVVSNNQQREDSITQTLELYRATNKGNHSLLLTESKSSNVFEQINRLDF
jgi:hypothetical protein